MDTYLIYRLTSGRTFATDHTNASRTLLYNFIALDWDAELCQLFGVARAALAEPRESSAHFGDTTLAGLLPRPLPICGVIGDSQAALLAQRCFTPGSAKVTFGTGSSLLLPIGPEPRLSDHGLVTALAWVLAGQPTYAFEALTNFTGATLPWLRDQLQLIQTVEETETLATSVPDTAGVYLVPAFVGLGAPYWRSEVRAGILGLTPTATRAHVVRAALESIAYTVNDALQLMGQAAGVTVTTVAADGGGTRNRFLMQFVADLTQRPVRAAQLPELSALGAALLGALGLGVYRTLDELQTLPLEYAAYAPRLAAAEVGVLLAGWRQAVAQILYTP